MFPSTTLVYRGAHAFTPGILAAALFAFPCVTYAAEDLADASDPSGNEVPVLTFGETKSSGS